MKAYVSGYALLGSHNLPIASLLEYFFAQKQGPYYDYDANTPQKTDTRQITEYFPPRSLRQLGHYEYLALLGARLALINAQEKDFSDTAIILASGYGPAQPTFSFLDSILDHGQGLASPLAFSHSVHNIPTAVIAQKLNSHSPCYTICQPQQPVYAALTLACSLFATQQVSTILFIALDEITPPLLATTQLLRHKNTPSHPKQLAENGTFFYLTRTPTEQTKGVLTLSQANDVAREVTGEITREITGDRPLFLSGGNASVALTNQTYTAENVYGITPINQAVNIALALEAMCTPLAPHSQPLAEWHTQGIMCTHSTSAESPQQIIVSR